MSLDKYVYTMDFNELAGPVTEGNPIRNLLGDNLSVTGGQLDAAGGGGGGFSTKATATGQEGGYEFNAGTASDMTVGVANPGSGRAYVEQRTGTFAADGVPSVRDRGPHAGTVGGDYLYLWERDLSTVTGGARFTGGFLGGADWDGTNYAMCDRTNSYIYQLDAQFNVVGGRSTLTGQFYNSPRGIAWDGSNFWNGTGAPVNSYIYQLDSNFVVTGGGETPGGSPRGLTWDGTSLFLGDASANYIYELNTSLTVIGGASFDAGPQIEGIAWDGSAFIVSDGVPDYVYILDTEFEVIGGKTGQSNLPIAVAWDGGRITYVDGFTPYLYEFAGSFDFTAGVLS